MSFKPKWRPPVYKNKKKLLTSYTHSCVYMPVYSLMRQRDIIQQEKALQQQGNEIVMTNHHLMGS